MLAVGEPVGAPAGQIVGMGGVAVGTLIEKQAEAGAIEFVGGVDGSAPGMEAALFGLDEGEAEGGVMTGGQASHPGGGR